MKTAARTSPLIKVCGLTREEDMRLCLDLGVDFTGFIFVPGSKRRIDPALAARLPRGCAARVGVFAGQSPKTVLRVMRQAKLDYAQLHGGEDAACCRAIGRERVIKVLWPEKLLRQEKDATRGSDTAALLHEACAPFADSCAYFLLDAGHTGGGSGRQLDWRALRHFSPPRPWLLAGGIGPLLAAEAFSACDPDGMDCNSNLETTPGRKEAQKVRALLAAIRNQYGETV